LINRAPSLVVCEYVLISLRRRLTALASMQSFRYYLSVLLLLQKPWYDGLPMLSSFMQVHCRAQQSPAGDSYLLPRTGFYGHIRCQPLYHRTGKPLRWFLRNPIQSYCYNNVETRISLSELRTVNTSLSETCPNQSSVSAVHPSIASSRRRKDGMLTCHEMDPAS
jgi:hypothetical protein